MRGKKAAINTIFKLIQEFVSIVCGLILPRLILVAFGSKLNGLSNSILQFLGYAVLLRSGIGGATRVALYKPLEEKNQNKISSIINATDIFMKKIGFILAGFIVVFAAVFSLFLQKEFEWLFTFTLVLIIGISSFTESFFGITYFLVLEADQRVWIQSALYSICLIINTLLSALLINSGASIHLVKLGSALVFVAYPLFLGHYVKHHYKIDKHVEPDNIAISQRWDAFWHQISSFIMGNTDIMVLTVFSNLLEVSVYSIYNMILIGLRKTVISFSSGLEAAFGNMIVRKENETLRQSIRIVEMLMFSISTIVYTCTSIVIFNFIEIYTKNVTDVNYIRPVFAYIIILAQFFNAVRLPYQLVVQAAGHYKQTKIGAIIEPIINISISIICVIKYGLVGVAIGTLVATIFRTIQYSTYMSNHIIPRSKKIVFHRIVLSAVECMIIYICMYFIHLPISTGYLSWFLNSLVTMAVGILIVFIGNSVFYKSDMIITYKKIKKIISH